MKTTYQNGFSLIEVLMVTGLISISSLAFASLLSAMATQQRFTNEREAARQLQQKFQRALQNDTYFNALVEANRNRNLDPRHNVGFDALRFPNQSPYANPTDPRDPFQLPVLLNPEVSNPSSPTAPFYYDSTNPNAGFTLNGIPCNSHGSDPECPLRLSPQWRPSCAGNPVCTNPRAVITMDFSYNRGTDHARHPASINADRLDFTIDAGSPRVENVLNCRRLGGQWLDPEDRCEYRQQYCQDDDADPATPSRRVFRGWDPQGNAICEFSVNQSETLCPPHHRFSHHDDQATDPDRRIVCLPNPNDSDCARSEFPDLYRTDPERAKRQAAELGLRATVIQTPTGGTEVRCTFRDCGQSSNGLADLFRRYDAEGHPECTFFLETPEGQWDGLGGSFAIPFSAGVVSCPTSAAETGRYFAGPTANQTPIEPTAYWNFIPQDVWFTQPQACAGVSGIYNSANGIHQGACLHDGVTLRIKDNNQVPPTIYFSVQGMNAGNASSVMDVRIKGRCHYNYTRRWNPAYYNPATQNPNGT